MRNFRSIVFLIPSANRAHHPRDWSLLPSANAHPPHKNDSGRCAFSLPGVSRPSIGSFQLMLRGAGWPISPFFGRAQELRRGRQNQANCHSMGQKGPLSWAHFSTANYRTAGANRAACLFLEAPEPVCVALFPLELSLRPRPNLAAEILRRRSCSYAPRSPSFTTHVQDAMPVSGVKGEGREAQACEGPRVTLQDGRELRLRRKPLSMSERGNTVEVATYEGETFVLKAVPKVMLLRQACFGGGEGGGKEALSRDLCSKRCRERSAPKNLKCAHRRFSAF
eukprot:scaffold7381_cov310-Pinguiococcus_pyrenoidosus.AAC.123